MERVIASQAPNMKRLVLRPENIKSRRADRFKTRLANQGRVSRRPQSFA